MEAYYYSHMNKREQSVYHAMKSGLTALASSFPVPKMEGKELGDIFFKLRLDCPEIFYAVSFHYRFYQGADNVEMLPEYLFDKAKVKEHKSAMEARVAKLARAGAGLTEWEEERYIHDFICSNVRYDKLKKPYSHEIIGPLGQGVGVCEGIAKSVKILCDALGIWCMIAISDKNTEKGIKYRHAWNIVRIGGTYYHLDATFDNSLGRDGIIRYDYFNLDDGRFFKDHEPLLYEAPPCGDGNHFYYKEKKLSFTKAEEVFKRAQQAARKGRPFLFHWRGGYLTREVLAELAEGIRKAAEERGMYVKLSLNWPQAVILAVFVKEAAEKEIRMENANEGEE